MKKLFKRDSYAWSIVGAAVLAASVGFTNVNLVANAESSIAAPHHSVSALKTENTKILNNKTKPASNHARLLKQIYDLAKQGKVVGANFVSGKTLIDEVHKKWGQPDKPVGIGDPYEVYSLGMGRGSFAFGIGKGEVIYDIRTFGSSVDPNRDIRKLTYSEIIKALGKPNEIRYLKNQEILVYKVGEYQLKFIVVKQGANKNNYHVDHINVYSPKAAKPMGGSEKY